MVRTSNTLFKRFVFCAVVLVLISGSECKGGGHSSGGHSSSHSSSHGSSHSSSSSGHSSYGSSHTSYGGSHTSYGGSHTSSGGSYSYGSSGHFASPAHSPGYASGTGSGYHPIGFDHVNQQAHNSLNSRPNTAGSPGIGFDHVNSQASGHATYHHPYKPQTVVHSSGVHYQPPTQLQYSPPVTTIHHTSTHYVPVYQPTVIHTQSGGDSGSSFLGGYLVGRMSSGGHGHSYSSQHITNNYYNSDDSSNTNSYYTVHHYHHNRDKVPSGFSVSGEELTECQGSATNELCVPNTNAFCLKNETIMCTTPLVLTNPCGENSTDLCVYSRIPCNPNLACNQTSNQTYVDFYLPCIANLTYLDNRVYDSNYYVPQGNTELCVTAIAHPRKLESPVVAVSSFIAELGKWHLDLLNDIHNLSNPVNVTVL